MKSNYFLQLSQKDSLPRIFAECYGATPEKFFIATPELKKKHGKRFGEIPFEAIGVYTYLTERVGVGLKQMMAAHESGTGAIGPKRLDESICKSRKSHWNSNS
jgi:hypothetical protein